MHIVMNDSISMADGVVIGPNYMVLLLFEGEIWFQRRSPQTGWCQRRGMNEQ